ncbi:hypothetical protein F4559_000890 [Saccharothrix violaceirubra]|uniref:Uncharacterized protein n=1 Tax=Saccharothrix violaceirubra TaxID=413306 RepID=A0A7W7SYY2_9PSEU|nr:hypothetical protein [Saccharothrix violaceirubra]
MTALRRSSRAPRPASSTTDPSMPTAADRLPKNDRDRRLTLAGQAAGRDRVRRRTAVTRSAGSGPTWCRPGAWRWCAAPVPGRRPRQEVLVTPPPCTNTTARPAPTGATNVPASIRPSRVRTEAATPSTDTTAPFDQVAPWFHDRRLEDRRVRHGAQRASVRRRPGLRVLCVSAARVARRHVLPNRCTRPHPVSVHRSHRTWNPGGRARASTPRTPAVVRSAHAYPPRLGRSGRLGSESARCVVSGAVPWLDPCHRRGNR